MDEFNLKLIDIAFLIAQERGGGITKPTVVAEVYKELVAEFFKR